MSRWRIPRPRFSLLTLLLGVLFAGACFGLWWRWEPWVVERSFVSNMANMAILSADFSPDGERIVTSEFDGGIGIWSIDGRLIRHWIGHTYHAVGAVFSQDGKRILSASDDNTVRLWDAESGRRMVVLTTGSNNLWDAMLLLGEKKVVTWNSEKGVFLWDIDEACKRTADAEARRESVLISLDGRCTGLPCALSGDDGELASFLQKCPPTNEEEASGVVSHYESAVVSPDGQWALLERDDGTFLELGQVPACVPTLVQGKGKHIVAVSRSGCRVLLSDSETRIEPGSVSIADVSGKRVPLVDQPTRVSSVKFSWDETRVLGAGPDQFACVWDSESAERLAMLPLPKCGFFKSADISSSRDGNRLLIACLGESESALALLTLWSRRRPERWWGIAWLPEFWIAYFSGGALLVIAARNLRRREESGDARG